MTQTTTTYNISTLLSKKDILFRLFNAGHITFDELWVLTQETVVTNYITQPSGYQPYLPSFEITYNTSESQK